MVSAVLEQEVGDPTTVDLALASYEASFDHLLKLVEDGGLADYDDAALVAALQWFERLRNRHALIDHRMVREGQQRRLPDTVTQPSMTGVLSWALRISRGEAGRRVRAAEQLGDRQTMTGQALPALRPALAAAQRSGTASPEQVDVCLRAIGSVDHRGFDPADLEAADELLAGFTATHAPRELRDLAGQIVDRIDPDGTRPDDELNHDRRHFALRRARDGMVVGEFRLTATLGAKLTAVLSPLTAPRATTTTLDDGRTVTEADPRHHGQRMHDALEDACDRLLRCDALPESGGTPATVIVTIGLDDLERRTGHGTTSDGTRVSADQIIRDLADQALVHPVVVDARGAVLWLGRTVRLATRAQTLALIARDGGCSFPGCQHPPEFCERHHIVAWIDGGPTDLDNLTLLCHYHHHNFLARGWTCRMIDGLPAWTPPAWVDPARRPVVNTRVTARHLRC